VGGELEKKSVSKIATVDTAKNDKACSNASRGQSAQLRM
jgi:hypothetical protein